MSICIMPEKIQAFKEAIKNKDISLSDLMFVESAERIKILEEYAGKDAETMSALFEQKLVLKNKMLGLKNLVSKLGEIGRYDPAKKIEIKEALDDFKAKQAERIFNPKEDEVFYAGLAEKILGTEVSREEAQAIFAMSAKGDQLKENHLNSKTLEWSSEEKRMDWVINDAMRNKYIDDLNTGSFKGYVKEVQNMWDENKPGTIATVLGDSANKINQTLINAVASWDNSFIGRQGAITLVKSPKIWWNMAEKSFKDIKKTLRGSDLQVYLARSEAMSRPNGINGNYEVAKLFPKTEEETPTKTLEYIPVIGKGFKVFDVAFQTSAIRARADLFDMMIDISEKTNEKIDDVLIKDLGSVVNAITARGKVGRIGASGPVQLLMWAPRMLKADWDVLTVHTFGAGLKTNFARKQSAKTITNVVIATAAVAAIASAMGADVEKDPRSSDFLQIKKGNTRIRIPFTRGMTQIVTLFARAAMGLAGKPAVKSTTTGELTKLNSGKYGSKTVWDVGLDFLVNKTTPPARIVIDQFRGRNFQWEKPTTKSVGFSLLPISVQNFIELKDEATTMSVFGAFADLFGISSNTYTSNALRVFDKTGIDIDKDSAVSKEAVRLDKSGNRISITDFDTSTSKKVAALKERVDSAQVKKEYADEVKKNFEEAIANEKYSDMSDEVKKKQLDHAADVALDTILERHFNKRERKKINKKAKPTKYIIK